MQTSMFCLSKGAYMTTTSGPGNNGAGNNAGERTADERNKSVVFKNCVPFIK